MGSSCKYGDYKELLKTRNHIEIELKNVNNMEKRPFFTDTSTSNNNLITNTLSNPNPIEEPFFDDNYLTPNQMR